MSGINGDVCGEEEDDDAEASTILPTTNVLVDDTNNREHTSSESQKSLPRTLLGRIVHESSLSAAKPASTPTPRFRASAMGKAMKVELLWEEDVGAELYFCTVVCNVFTALLTIAMCFTTTSCT